MATIHPTAVVDSGAEIAASAEVCAYAVIEKNVSIGEGTIVYPRAVISGWTTIGKNCRIQSGAVVGSEPQAKYNGQRSYVRLGDNNIVREFATINRATVEDGETKIGDNNMFCAYSHVAHDCHIMDGVVLSNCVNLAGHVTVEDGVILSGLVGVHQFCRVGRYAFVGGMSAVRQDVLPFTLVEGIPSRPYGLNEVGLQRRDFTREQMWTLRRAYRIIYRSNNSLDEAVEALQDELGDCEEVNTLVNFIKSCQRPICR